MGLGDSQSDYFWRFGNDILGFGSDTFDLYSRCLNAVFHWGCTI